MRVFISQPMRGKTDEEILRERYEAIERIKSNTNKDISIINSFFNDASGVKAPEDTISGLYLLGKSLELLATADVAYFCDGWSDARGCKIEHTCCNEYGVSIIKD